jgi:hypothetical protein
MKNDLPTAEERARLGLPSDEIMRQMSKLALETATEFFAKQAEEFASNLPPRISASQALKAFAAAIRSTNAKQFPKGPVSA